MEMRKYETMYIIRPTLDEEAVKGVVERFSDLIAQEGGQVEKIDEWGRRRLAYPIDDLKEGYYVLMNFSAPATLPGELERVYKITDSILRYTIIRDDD
jgi:small subunit ribosomal protein S6